MGKYIGGPCDGRTAPNDGMAIHTCGGATYMVGQNFNYHVTDEAAGAVGTGALGTHAPRSWAHLQRAVNRKLPTALRRAQIIRRATLHTMARRRRVG